MADEKFDKLLQKANEAIRRNNPDYAIQILDNVLKMNPDHGEGNGLYFQAVQKKYAAGAKVPKPSRMSSMKLLPLQKTKSWDRLLDSARTTFVKDPQNIKVLLMLAEALMNLKHHNGAIVTLRRITEIESTNSIAWFWLAISLSKIDDTNESVRAAERARVLDKTNKDIADFYRNISARNTIAASRLDTAKSFGDIVKDKASAQHLVDQARKLTPEQVKGRIVALGGWEKASEYKELKTIADLYVEVQDYQNAVKSYKKIYQLNPTSADALDRAGEYTVKFYDKLIAQAKATGEADKAKAYSRKKMDFELEEFKRRVEAHPTDLSLRYRYGEVLFRAKRYMDAAGELQKAVKDPKNKIRVVETLAQCFIEIDQLDLAVMQLDDALGSLTDTMDDKRKMLLYLKASALERKGDGPEAKQIYMQILSEDISFRDVAERVKAL